MMVITKVGRENGGDRKEARGKDQKNESEKSNYTNTNKKKVKTGKQMKKQTSAKLFLVCTNKE